MFWEDEGLDGRGRARAGARARAARAAAARAGARGRRRGAGRAPRAGPRRAAARGLGARRRRLRRAAARSSTSSTTTSSRSRSAARRRWRTSRSCARRATGARAPGSARIAAPWTSRALRTEAVALLRELIRVDTSNPPGNETAAAELLRDYLVRHGIECELVARKPGPREPDRADPRRERPVARAHRAHRRRPRRRARLAAPAVLRRPRRRRLHLGPRRGRHEEPHRDERRRAWPRSPARASGPAATCC